MKISVLNILLVSVYLLVAHPAAAQTQKFAGVNLKKVFDGYWKTKQADLNLKDRAAELDKRRKEMVSDYQKANEQYKALLDQANDRAVSVAERDRRKGLAESKLREIQEIEQSLQQFDRSARATLGEQQRNMRDKIVVEIRELLNRKARADGFAVVFDTSAESITSTPIVLLSEGLTDITEDLVKQLNASAPAGVLQNTP